MIQVQVLHQQLDILIRHPLIIHTTTRVIIQVTTIHTTTEIRAQMHITIGNKISRYVYCVLAGFIFLIKVNNYI